MARQLKNKISESKALLPVVVVYTALVWLAGGLVEEQLWVEMACFLATAYIVAETLRSNALISIYSSMGTAAFMTLSCAACFSIGDTAAAIITLCMAASIMIIFNSYQVKDSPVWTYYAFIFLGGASLMDADMLYYAPLLWILMSSSLMSLCWRNFIASLLGMLTPYWFAGLYFLYKADAATPINHFSTLWQFCPIADLSSLDAGRWAAAALMIIVAITGIVHYQRYRHNDNIKNRMLNDFLMVMTVATAVFIVLQPCHFDNLIRIMALCSAPLIAHFISLTETRAANIFFMALTTAAVGITIYNTVWTHL